MSVNHPDVIEFIEKKQDLTKVTGANVSVKITDEFMKAVENNEDYLLRWPIDFNPSPEFINDLPYDKLVSIGESFNKPVYCKKIKARTLWNKLVHCAWNTGEPRLTGLYNRYIIYKLFKLLEELNTNQQNYIYD